MYLHRPCITLYPGCVLLAAHAMVARTTAGVHLTETYTRTLVTSITSSVDSMTFSIAEAAAFVTPPLIGSTPLSRDGAHLPVFGCKDYVSADVTGWRSAGTGVHRLACVRAGHVTGRQGGWRRWHGDGDGRGRRRQKRRYVRPLTFRRGSTLTLTRTMTDLDPA